MCGDLPVQSPPMSLALNIFKKTSVILAYCTVGAVAALLLIFVLYANNKPDLELWHTTFLESEFTAQTGLKTLDEYRALEDRLFDELQEKIISRLPPEKSSLINRFTPNSLANPDRWPRNWNRTYELEAKEPSAGILMLHGLSDSPYSLRSLGTHLNAAGAWVVGLRVPGHGTAPSGLVKVRWQDMTAAVRLAMQHLRDTVGDKPLYIVGYSNGGALAVHYALTALDNSALPQARRLVLLSPAIGIAPVAGAAVWQARLGRLLGLENLAWLDVLPEYDPYKYQSFAINAGDLQLQLTNEIQRLIMQSDAAQKLQDFPPTLAFSSAIDATVSTRALVQDLFMKLPPNHHELIAVDLNRREGTEFLFKHDPKTAIDMLLDNKTLPFDFGIVSNRNTTTTDVVLRLNTRGNPSVTEQVLGLSWPKGIYSLSHVAIPFPSGDPLYGGPNARKSPGIALGNITLRGEKGAMKIPARDMLRQRWNPFYALMEKRTENFLINSR